MVTLDFETEAIQPAPLYPPKPVSVSFQVGRKNHFLAWGLQDENNCTFAQAKRELAKYKKEEFIFHNAAFELAILEDSFGWTPDRFHDTLFLLFLENPRSYNLSLKPNAERLLGLPPSERDAVRDWILENIKESKPSTWGNYICKAPYKILKPYNIDDVKKTEKLFQRLYPEVKKRGMLEAYEVELQILPEVLNMEKHGVPIARTKLKRDTCEWDKELKTIEDNLHKKLGDINLGSGSQLAKALDAKNLVSHWEFTGKGNRKTSRASLTRCIRSKKLIRELERRSVLDHMLSNFCHPWLTRMDDSGEERLYPRWNQVRGRDDKKYGTRTGRFSSNDPSFQQLNREPEDLSLPFMRQYVLPEKGHVLLGRDFNQQEFRIFSHFEDGDLMNRYLANPYLDAHQETGDMIAKFTLHPFERRHYKGINFGKIYGMGVTKLAVQLGLTLKDAQELNNAHRKAFPGLRLLQAQIKDRVSEDLPIRTRGGREYYCEPSYRDPETGKTLSFEYKLLNTLVQGSAADHTKRAFIQICRAMKEFDARVMLQVHDEFLNSAPKENKAKCMAAFREAMDFDYFDVLTPSDGKTGMNWGAMKSYKEKLRR